MQTWTQTQIATEADRHRERKIGIGAENIGICLNRDRCKDLGSV